MTRPQPTLLIAALAALSTVATPAVATDLRGPAPTEGMQYEYRATGEASERGRYIYETDSYVIEGTIESEVESRLRYQIADLHGETVIGATITFVELNTQSEIRINGERTDENSGGGINGLALNYEVKDGYWECDVDSPTRMTTEAIDMMEFSGFYDPRMLYPAGDVAVDTTWTLEGTDINYFPAALTFPGAEVQGGGTFKYLGTHEEDGQTYAVIEFGFDVSYELENNTQGMITVTGSRMQYGGYIYRNLETYMDTVVMEGTSVSTVYSSMAGSSMTMTKIEPRQLRVEQSMTGRGANGRRPGPVAIEGDNNRRGPAPGPRTDDNNRRGGPAPVRLPDNNDDNPRPNNNDPQPNPRPDNNDRPTPRPAPIPQPDNGDQPTPRPAPTPTPRPAPTPEPDNTDRPTPRPNPTPRPAPTPEPDNSDRPTPRPNPTPRPEPRPAPSPQPDNTDRPAPRPAPQPAPQPEPRPGPRPQ